MAASAQPESKDITPQQLATMVHQGNVSEVKQTLSIQPKLANTLDDAGRLPIHWAASGGHLELFQFLLSALEQVEEKADCDSLELQDDVGWTPLMIAVSAGHKDLVKFLLDSHSDPSSQNYNGQTPLHYAASKNHMQIAEMLAEHGAAINAQDKYGSTPLHRAASKGNTQMTLFLMSQSECDINLPDGQGNTALHLACEEGRHDEAVALVKRGAHLDRQNKEEKTPLQLADPGLQKALQRLAGNNGK